jgi:hypothetical protein
MMIRESNAAATFPLPQLEGETLLSQFARGDISFDRPKPEKAARGRRSSARRVHSKKYTAAGSVALVLGVLGTPVFTGGRKRRMDNRCSVDPLESGARPDKTRRRTKCWRAR